MLKKKWFRSLFRQRILVAFLILLQIGVLAFAVVSGSRVFSWLTGTLTLLSILVVLALPRKEKGSYRTLWVFLILSFPIFGGLMYLLMKFQGTTRKMQKQLLAAQERAKPLFLLPENPRQAALDSTGAYATQVRYLQDYAGFPVYSGTRTTYFPLGEDMLAALLPQLQKAKHYIFLEFFIIQEGKMWDSILAILKQKAAEGVKVRVMYDDMGCFFLLPANYKKQLEHWGIECGVFNPFRPFLTVKQNNRDHRKIVVIDGQVAFTGGVNLADEYINAYEKYGHWKDTAVMLEGTAAWSFALMFLQMWQVCTGIREEWTQYYHPCRLPSDGLVLPYTDSPLDTEHVGEHVYLQILNQAADYVYINTPYLIVDDALLSALCLAAKRGVDVRIVTPHRWDKWAVHMTTRSYYRELIAAGVKVYEYTGGFIHAKSYVCDDRIATVGTTNMDYRSLYLHFECGVWMYGSQAVAQAKADYLATLTGCQRITEADCKAGPLLRLLQEIFRLFAPLM